MIWCCSCSFWFYQFSLILILFILFRHLYCTIAICCTLEWPSRTSTNFKRIKIQVCSYLLYWVWYNISRYPVSFTIHCLLIFLKLELIIFCVPKRIIMTLTLSNIYLIVAHFYITIRRFNNHLYVLLVRLLYTELLSLKTSLLDCVFSL
jgi:hypothetical protein